MPLYLVVILCALGYMAAHAFNSKPRSRTDDVPIMLARAGRQAVLSYIELLFLWATIVYAVLWIVAMLFPISPSALFEMLRKAQHFKAWSEAAHIKVIFTAFTAAGIAWLLYQGRSVARNRVSEKVDQYYKSEVERLDAQREAGKWDDLEPTADMNAVAAEIVRVRSLSEREGLSDGTRSDLLKESERLAIMWHVMDYRRRFHPYKGPEEDDEPSGVEGILGRLLSASAFTILKKIKHANANLAMVLLLLAYVGFASGPVTNQLQNEAIAWQQMQIQRELAKYTQPSGQPNIEAQSALRRMSSSDAASVRVLARAFEVAITRNLERKPDADRQTLLQFQGLDARDRALQELTPGVPDLGQVASLSHDERDVAWAVQSAERDASGPTTDLGQAFIGDFAKYVSPSSPRWKTTRDEIRTIGIFSRLNDFTGDIVSQLVGHFIPEEHASDLWGNVQTHIAPEALPEMSRRLYALGFARFEAAYQRTGSVRKALEELSAPNELRPLITIRERASLTAAATKTDRHSMLTELDAHPPSYPMHAEQNAVDHVNVNLLKQTEQLRSREGIPVATDQRLEALSGYQDYFPAGFGDESRTPVGILRGAPVDATTRISTGTAESASDAVASMNLARDFVALEGFSRIGGVLIGRGPDGAGTLGVQDAGITRLSGDRVLLWYVAGGARRFIGPFDATVTRHALAYAADGRPIATTMTSAQPLPDLKIQLHPALVNTTLGRHIIALDQFVDTYVYSASPDETRSEFARLDEAAQAMARSASMLYDFSWAVRLTAIEAANDARANSAFSDQQLRFARELETTEQLQPPEAPTVDNLEQAVTSPDLFDPELSPLRERPQYYDQSLVSAMQHCVKKASDIPKYERCVYKLVLPDAQSVTSDDDPALSLPPRIQIWSGVRERPFTPKNAFADAEPLVFVQQVSFVSRPSFSDNVTKENSGPWYFASSLEKTLDVLVRNDAKENDAKAYVYSDALAFTKAQRYFRLMLSAKEWNHYDPTAASRMARQLSFATSDAERTPRWLPHPEDELSAESVLKQARSAYRALPDSYESEAREIALAISRCSDDINAPSCTFSPAARQADVACRKDFNVCTTRDGLIYAEYNRLVERLRQRLNIDDEVQYFYKI